MLLNVIKELAHVLSTLTNFDEEDWNDIEESLYNLRNVNRDLWHLEETIRLLTKEGKSESDTVLQLVKDIHKKNSERADIKRFINDRLDEGFSEMKDYESLNYVEPKDPVE